jgi:hypothetical protein
MRWRRVRRQSMDFAVELNYKLTSCPWTARELEKCAFERLNSAVGELASFVFRELASFVFMWESAISQDSISYTWETQDTSCPRFSASLRTIRLRVRVR